jgi:hypothetical protein
MMLPACALLLLVASERNSDMVRGIAGANLRQDVVLVVTARCLDYVTELTRVGHALFSNLEVCGQIYLDEEK